ncbi:MAG: (Fe-S)-binding protein, partial [Dehalococcoidia bacterium]
FMAVREEVIEKQLSIPPMVKKFLENVYLYGNSYRESRESRADWAEGSGIKEFDQNDEYLYYVGCVGSYDTCSRRAARALGEVLERAGVSFGILGTKEECDGNEVRLLGEQGLFELQRDKNVEMFRQAGVKKIVTLSPHSYNAFKNHYPDEFEVLHYTQLLRDLISSGKLDVSRGFEATVTYHDPCFLGRHNKEYDAPRDILNAIGGINLVEMERNRENAFCCGGGSGNFYTGISAKGKEQASNARAQEAYRTGAKVLAVACPICMLMLEDAVKTEQLEEQIQVKDISEIVLASLG